MFDFPQPIVLVWKLLFWESCAIGRQQYLLIRVHSKWMGKLCILLSECILFVDHRAYTNCISSALFLKVNLPKVISSLILSHMTSRTFTFFTAEFAALATPPWFRVTALRADWLLCCARALLRRCHWLIFFTSFSALWFKCPCSAICPDWISTQCTCLIFCAAASPWPCLHPINRLAILYLSPTKICLKVTSSDFSLCGGQMTPKLAQMWPRQQQRLLQPQHKGKLIYYSCAKQDYLMIYIGAWAINWALLHFPESRQSAIQMSFDAKLT